MAATVPEYVDELLRRQASAAGQIGVDIFGVGPELYRVNLTLLTLVGVLMKALNDKGVVLDAEWLARLDTALDGTWPAWMTGQHNPNQVP